MKILLKYIVIIILIFIFKINIKADAKEDSLIAYLTNSFNYYNKYNEQMIKDFLKGRMKEDTSRIFYNYEKLSYINPDSLTYKLFPTFRINYLDDDSLIKISNYMLDTFSFPQLTFILKNDSLFGWIIRKKDSTFTFYYITKPVIKNINEFDDISSFIYCIFNYCLNNCKVYFYICGLDNKYMGIDNNNLIVRQYEHSSISTNAWKQHLVDYIKLHVKAHQIKEKDIRKENCYDDDSVAFRIIIRN